MASAETMNPAGNAAEINESTELFSRLQVAKVTRIALVGLGILVIPGAIPVAAVGGALWLANRMRTQEK